MRIQLDSEKKTIKIEGNVKLSELVKYLESLLPRDCKLGYWKDYELETNVSITYWSNPIVIEKYTPYKPWWEYQPYYGTSSDLITNNCTTTINGNSILTTNCVYNLEL